MAACELDEGVQALERGSRVVEQESRPRSSCLCQAFAELLDCLNNRGLCAKELKTVRHHHNSRLSMPDSKRYCAAPDLFRRGVLLQVVNYLQPWMPSEAPEARRMRRHKS